MMTKQTKTAAALRLVPRFHLLEIGFFAVLIMGMSLAG